MTVEASALHAQAQSGERSGTIRADEIKDTQLRGRDFQTTRNYLRVSSHNSTRRPVIALSGSANGATTLK